MKLVLIADTHNMHDEIEEMPAGDILICAGDITRKGQLSDALRFNEWVRTLRQYRYVLLIAGNHDLLFQDAFNRELMTNVTFLHDSATKIKGITFTGSPWTPKYGNWAFMRPRGEEMARIWSCIPKQTDVLITHGPPFGILDEVKRYNGVIEHTGCEDLFRRVDQIIRPKLHIFGHIHEGYGKTEWNGITYVNASICTGSYDPTNKPIVIDI